MKGSAMNHKIKVHSLLRAAMRVTYQERRIYDKYSKRKIEFIKMDTNYKIA